MEDCYLEAMVRVHQDQDCVCVWRGLVNTVVTDFFVIVYLFLFLDIKDTVILEIVFVSLIPNLLPLSEYTITSKMFALNLDDLDYNDLNKHLLTQINIDDRPDKYVKCGQSKLLRKSFIRCLLVMNLENLLMYSARFGQNTRRESSLSQLKLRR